MHVSVQYNQSIQGSSISVHNLFIVCQCLYLLSTIYINSVNLCHCILVVNCLSMFIITCVPKLPQVSQYICVLIFQVVYCLSSCYCLLFVNIYILCPQFTSIQSICVIAFWLLIVCQCYYILCPQFTSIQSIYVIAFWLLIVCQCLL